MQTRDELLRFLAETDQLTPGMLPREAYMLIRSVASNPDTPCRILELLSRMTGQADLMERVAENPSTPPEVLECLAHDEDPKVRAAVAENGNVRIHLLWELAYDENPQVRYELAENPRIPLVILDFLREDENPYVSNRASETMARIDESNREPNVFQKVVKWVRGSRRVRRSG